MDYEYRICKYEVTTAQWMEFVNTCSTLGGTWTFFGLPVHWGARPDPNYFGPGRRYVLKDIPNAQMMAVYGISWRTAAMFCNWLHNGKASGVGRAWRRRPLATALSAARQRVGRLPWHTQKDTAAPEAGRGRGAASEGRGRANAAAEPRCDQRLGRSGAMLPGVLRSSHEASMP